MKNILVANIVRNSIVVCSLCEEGEVEQAVKQILQLANQPPFNIEEFIESGYGIMGLTNGSTLQVMSL